MTPYAASKIVNATLKTEGLDKKVPPQMIYSYVSKGYIKSVDVDGKKRVTEETLQEWLVKYVAKLSNKVETEIVETEIVPDDDGTVGEWTETEFASDES
jgi:hypothetical protein